MNKHTDPRTIPLGEWSKLPLPEGREGEQVEVDHPVHGSVDAFWRDNWGAWRSDEQDLWWHPAAPWGCSARWRWVRRLLPEARRDAVELDGVKAALLDLEAENYRTVTALRSLERIVGEVQQALAGKPADQCVTDEGRAVAGLWDGLDYYLGRDDDGVAIDTFTALEALCAEKGWKP